MAGARGRPGRPRSRRSVGWAVLRIVFVACLASLLRLAACGESFRMEHDAWDANPAHRLAKLFGWRLDGGLAIENARWSNRLIDNAYWWRARVLDPSVIDALVSASQLGRESAAAPLRRWGDSDGRAPSWWLAPAPDALGTVFTRSDEQDERWWWLWYDPVHRVVFIEAGFW